MLIDELPKIAHCKIKATNGDSTCDCQDLCKIIKICTGPVCTGACLSGNLGPCDGTDLGYPGKFIPS